MASNLPPQMIQESFGTVVYTLDSGIFSRFTPLDPPCSVSTGPPLVGCSHSLHTDGLVCKEVDGVCLKLHYCTPGLVRTGAESTPYKGATSPIPLEPLLLLLSLLLLLLLLLLLFYFYEEIVKYITCQC